MKAPHLHAAVVALFLVAGIITAGHLYVESVLNRSVHALAPQVFDQKQFGVALQLAALRQPDLLPIYGSSELALPNPYQASALFKNYPTDFTVFPVGRRGASSCLLWLQNLAAVAPDLHGKKVAFSVYPGSFYLPSIDSFTYAANYSGLHASALAFSTRLSFAIKQAAARRMLQYPDTLTNDPFLRFALETLADGSALKRGLYYVLLPLGKLRNVVLRLQDEWEMLVFLHKQAGLQTPMRQPHALDWPALISRAGQEAQQLGESNPFGFEKTFWRNQGQEVFKEKDSLKPAEVLDILLHSAEWTDFELLLQALRQLGAQPLILSPPLKGAYYDYVGVPYAIREAYYQNLTQLAHDYNAQVTDFSSHDSDHYFTVDWWVHLSREGWIYYDQALDAFFHSNNVRGEG